MTDNSAVIKAVADYEFVESMVRKCRALPPVRAQRILRIRDEVERGVYETPARLAATADAVVCVLMDPLAP